MCEFKEIITGAALIGLLVLFIAWAAGVMEAEHAEYMQLCQDNGYTELQCQLRYKELTMSHRSGDYSNISVGTGIVQ
jgi:hypothetical protein